MSYQRTGGMGSRALRTTHATPARVRRSASHRRARAVPSRPAGTVGGVQVDPRRVVRAAYNVAGEKRAADVAVLVTDTMRAPHGLSVHLPLCWKGPVRVR